MSIVSIFTQGTWQRQSRTKQCCGSIHGIRDIQDFHPINVPLLGYMYFLNPVWHDVGKQEKCLYLETPRDTFYKTKWAGQNWCKFLSPKSLELCRTTGVGCIICFPDLLMGRFQCENLKSAKGTEMEKESGGEIGSQIPSLEDVWRSLFWGFLDM